MQERIAPQHIPVKLYRSEERLTIAAPMPGMEPEDIVVEVTEDGRLILDGKLVGALKGVKDLLIDEWSVGGYHRELPLPMAVDGTLATVTYGNGVLVVTLPIAERMRGVRLTLEDVGSAHGEHVGSAGHPVRPVTKHEHHGP
jgi:HSP20 family protein